MYISYQFYKIYPLRTQSPITSTPLNTCYSTNDFIINPNKPETIFLYICSYKILYTRSIILNIRNRIINLFNPSKKQLSLTGV